MKKISKLAAFAVACSLALTAVGCNTNAAESSASVLGGAEIKDFVANVFEGAIVVSWTKPEGKSDVELYRYNDKTGNVKLPLTSGNLYGNYIDKDIVDGETYVYTLVNPALYDPTEIKTWHDHVVASGVVTGSSVTITTDKDPFSMTDQEAIYAKVSAKANVPARLSTPTEADFNIIFEKDYLGWYTISVEPKDDKSGLYGYKYTYFDKKTGFPIFSNYATGSVTDIYDDGWKKAGTKTPQFPFTLEITRIVGTNCKSSIKESEPFKKDFDFTSSFIGSFGVTADASSKEDTIILTWSKLDVATEPKYSVFIRDTNKNYMYWEPVAVENLTTDPTDPSSERYYLEIPHEAEKTAYNFAVLVIAETAEGKTYATTTGSLSAIEAVNITMTAEIEGAVVFQFEAPANVPATDVKVLRSEKGNTAGTWIDVTESVAITSQAQMYDDGAVAYQVVDKNIANNKKYTYKVIAGKTSDTTGPITITGNVSSAAATYDAADKTVELTWTASREGGEFVVYRKELLEGSTTEYTLFAPVTVTTKVEKNSNGKELVYTAVDATVKPYQKYKYYIAASDDNNIGSQYTAAVETVVFEAATNLNITGTAAYIDPKDPAKGEKITNVVLKFKGNPKAADKYEVFYTTFDNKDNESVKTAVATTTDNSDDYEATVSATDLGIDKNYEFKLTDVCFYVYSYKNGKVVDVTTASTASYTTLPTSYKTLSYVSVTADADAKYTFTVLGHNLTGNVVKFTALNDVDGTINPITVTLTKDADAFVETYTGSVTLTKDVEYKFSATLAEEETADSKKVHIDGIVVRL